ncbi:MAG: DNA mismatch repair endonuclease MutL, partial [Oscillospiraceae bacterium]|nr:DNA mismatch repair endonuclease MutL [Oscillospiraceae bacterium]
DAGATAVTVEMRDGGMSYLRVSDDGCGIAPDELPTAFLRHATSKLRTAEDLSAIGTLGFRGEALAAIASVSRLEMLTRERGADSGASIRLEGGVPGEVVPAGCPEGTSVIVRELFFNTPARLKFMKRDSAEGAAISSLVTHLALSRPEVSFKLIKDGEEALHTPGDGSLKSAVYAALGREFTLSLTEVKGRDGELAVDGFATRPLNSRGTRAMQTFFVNSRLVKSQLLTAALEEAYANRIMKGKFPGCVLCLTLPLDMVDVNVHPAKTVVKFVNEKQVFDLVYHGVSDSLDRDAMPETPARTAASPVKKPDFYRSMTAEEFRGKYATAGKPSDIATAGEAPKPAAPFRTSVPPVDVGELRGAVRFSDVVKAPGLAYAPVKPAIPVPAPAAAHEPEPKPEQIQMPVPEPEPEQTTLLPETAAPWRIAGEVLDTYIVCEDADKNVWLIDKHAAHERVNFDRLKAQSGPVMSQSLLTPLVAKLGETEYAAALEHGDELRELGFECEDFGTGAVLLRAVPADIDEAEAVGALEELAGCLAEGGAGGGDKRDALLATIACKAAIKGGWKSDERELRALVDRVQSGEISYCPHGRPVKVSLTQREIEKMFKRII